MLHAMINGAVLLFAPVTIGSDECLRFAPITTSQLTVEAYVQYESGREVLPAPNVEVVVMTQREIASERTDKRGHVRFPSLPPGRYTLWMRNPTGGATVFQDVQLVDRGSGPSVTIAALFAPVVCSKPCAVNVEGLLTKPPACLFGK